MCPLNNAQIYSAPSKAMGIVVTHGVFISVYDVGVLLIGKSGIGKSDLALSLISRGHALIADDAIEFFPGSAGSLPARDIKNNKSQPLHPLPLKTYPHPNPLPSQNSSGRGDIKDKKSSGGGDILVGRPPKLLQHYLAIRDVGILDIKAMFGDQAVLAQKELSFVVHLKKSPVLDILACDPTPWSLLDITVPCFSLSVSGGRPCDVLLEAMVRNYALLQKGQNNHQIFLNNHHRAL